jgi:hypothetical protein
MLKRPEIFTGVLFKNLIKKNMLALSQNTRVPLPWIVHYRFFLITEGWQNRKLKIIRDVSVILKRRSITKRIFPWHITTAPMLTKNF